jgi:hypothetical protein
MAARVPCSSVPSRALTTLCSRETDSRTICDVRRHSARRQYVALRIDGCITAIRRRPPLPDERSSALPPSSASPPFGGRPSSLQAEPKPGSSGRSTCKRTGLGSGDTLANRDRRLTRGARLRYSDRRSGTRIEDRHNFQRRGAEPKTGTCPMTNPKRPLGWGMRRSLARLSAVAQS